MPEQCANIKADQALKLSNPAKILFGYMRASGITDAKQLATDLDIPLRTIQRLKLECASVVDANAKRANDAISGAANDAKRAISGVFEAPKAPDMAPRADINITTLRDNNITPGESRESEADRLARQAYLNGQALKGGLVAKSARAGGRTKGELDGSKGIRFADGELTVDDETAARLRDAFPGVDVAAVCDKAGPEVARMSYPTRDCAFTVLRKWARCEAQNAARGKPARGEVIPFAVSPDTVRYAKPDFSEDVGVARA
jgi:hypothetical protein